jgi:hypothetical protein
MIPYLALRGWEEVNTCAINGRVSQALKSVLYCDNDQIVGQLDVLCGYLGILLDVRKQHKTATTPEVIILAFTCHKILAIKIVMRPPTCSLLGCAVQKSGLRPTGSRLIQEQIP